VLWKEFFRSYEALLQSLPTKRQAIFRLHFHEDLPTKDIAAKLGLSRKTVQNQLGKAIEKLRISLSHLLSML
jgi:RNA polymerase sigma-70 factor (ECF subfamily)